MSLQNLKRFSRIKGHGYLFTHNIKRCSSQDAAKSAYKFVVVGGGAGGLSVASFLSRKFPHQVAVVEPSDVSYSHDRIHEGFGNRLLSINMKPVNEMIQKRNRKSVGVGWANNY